MKIHEYQAKELFARHGVNIPDGRLALCADDVEQIAREFGGTVAVKAQVHAGGRGKAGGIAVVQTPAEARAAAERILHLTIKDIPVRKLLVVESHAAIVEEAYVGILLDRAVQGITFICSAAGGVDIEQVARETPDQIIRFHTTNREFPEMEARQIAGRLFKDTSVADQVLQALQGLFHCFVTYDCTLAEINPLALNDQGKVVALDGKINIDDNALFRQPEIEALRDMDEEDPREIEAKKHGLSFVQLDGDIGCMVNGAGLAMATMDMIQLFGGRPANFLDVGGSSNPDKVVEAFRLLLDHSKVRAVLINIFGGITRCDDIARGILESYHRLTIDRPVVIRLSGTNAEEGRQLLADSPLITAETFEEAVKTAIAQSREVAQ